MPDANDPSDRPNILVIMSDQHDPRIMGCAGDRLSPTPNLDGLAASGVRLTNAHCPYPLCGPSRNAYMTARQPHDTGCLTNQGQIRSDEPTFAHAFNHAGYHTAITGRMHFVGHDQLHGFQERLVGDVPPSAYLLRHGSWGLDQVLGPLMQRATGMSPDVLRISGPGEQGYQAYDDAVVNSAEDWLRDRGDNQQPFLLSVGMLLPHCPFVAPPEDFYHFYEQISVDDLPDPHLEQLPPPLKKLRALWKLDKDPVSLETQRVVRAAYYGLVRYMDRLIGRLLNTLRETGLDQNTLVVYTSDHGEQLGEHGLWWKSTFYQGSVGVPMVMSWPGKLPQGKVATGNVSLTDVGPTLLDLVGGEPMTSATGQSFRSLLSDEGDASAWHDTAMSQVADANFVGRMVRNGPWKLMYYDGFEPILFNLDEDPGELSDRAADPSCAEILDRLMQLAYSDGWEPGEVRQKWAQRVEGERQFGEWVNATDPPEPHPPWFGDSPPVNRLDTIPGSSHRPPVS